MLPRHVPAHAAPHTGSRSIATALLHFAFGFLAVGGIAYLHARLLGEANGSFIGAGLIAGIACACLATFASPWASPVVVALLAAASHREYRDARAHLDASRAGAARRDADTADR